MSEPPRTETKRRRTRRADVVALALMALGLLSGLAALVLAAGARTTAGAEAFTAAAHEGPLPTLWQAPDFSLVDHHGKELTARSLRGRPYIADFIFTQCTSACPMMTAKMVQVQRRLATADLRFVSFSVDPAHDTPEALAAYAMRWNASETRWALLSTTEGSLAGLTAGFRVLATPSGASRDPILHSSVFFLVDGDGNVRAIYDSVDTHALDALVADATALAGHLASSRAPASPSSYAALGCGGCHEDPQVAPPLVDLRGTRRLATDASIDVDEAYLRASILEPGRDRVAGYAASMPSYRGLLTDAQLEALVAELRARTSDAGTADADGDVHVVVDPVCGMKVRAEPGAIHAAVDGVDRYFCSEVCRDAFVKEPRRFAADAAR